MSDAASTPRSTAAPRRQQPETWETVSCLLACLTCLIRTQEPNGYLPAVHPVMGQAPIPSPCNSVEPEGLSPGLACHACLIRARHPNGYLPAVHPVMGQAPIPSPCNSVEPMRAETRSCLLACLLVFTAWFLPRRGSPCSRQRSAAYCKIGHNRSLSIIWNKVSYLISVFHFLKTENSWEFSQGKE